MVTENEITSWLEAALAEENLQNFSFKNAGNTEKGSGYWGDVLFVSVTGVTQEGATKEYSLVLKCSKSNEALDTSYPMFKDVFLREIKVYRDLVPIYREFQEMKNITEPLYCWPKCYGTYEKGNRYILALENLKKIGFDVNDIKNPMTREHINLVVNKYAKFHATSVALREQEPGIYEKLVEYFSKNLFTCFFEQTSFESVQLKTVQQVYELFKDDLGEEISKKWLVFKDQLHALCYDLIPIGNHLKTLIHGDCWNNNFMFKYKDNDQSSVSEVSILDWQLATLGSPVKDLSYFLFACIAPKDVPDLNIILKSYHTAFCEHLLELGSSFGKSYPFEKFFEEWKTFASFGLMMCILPIKVTFTGDKEDLPDMAASAEKGEDIVQSFDFDLKDPIGYKKRLLPIVEYAAKTGII